MKNENSVIARATYDAYVRKDRAAIEALITDDFHFTSPSTIEPRKLFCDLLANSTNTEGFEFIHMIGELLCPTPLKTGDVASILTPLRIVTQGMNVG